MSELSEAALPCLTLSEALLSLCLTLSAGPSTADCGRDVSASLGAVAVFALCVWVICGLV